MKSHLFIVCFLFCLFSCTKSTVGPPVSDSDTSIIKEFHGNGVLKTEVSVVGDLREGLTKNYDRQGRLLSQVRYTKNQKEGTATNFYAATGNINSTLEFKNGVKHGDEKWFYESGTVYRISPYVDGVMSGLQKFYYESGQIMAEIPFQQGLPGRGLKEYNPDGSLITDYPSLIIRKEDHLKDANKILLVIFLSNNSQHVKFYKGSLKDSKYIDKKLLLLATQQGITQIDYNIPPGAMLSQTIYISANYKTPMGNPLILYKQYNLQAFNPN